MKKKKKGNRNNNCWINEKERRWNEKKVVTMFTGDDGERKNEMVVKKRTDYWECKESMAQKEGKNEIKKRGRWLIKN